MALCPVCDVASDAEQCPRCGERMSLGPGYVLERLLGAGGQSRVYAAKPPDGGEAVAIKVLSLSRVKDPKALELFRRSAEVLVGLSHPGIARLITYFEEMRAHAALYCLVQELVPGATLAKAGHFDEARAKDVALRALATLSYLHGLSPPVIHRDIKPSNLMQKPDGSIVLIDFDLVRDVLRPEGGSTLAIGTPGFTPMEQYLGEATPATDLYALGVTVAVLLARKDPTDMRRTGEQRLELKKHINVSEAFCRVLEKMTEIAPARRYQSAREVVRDLERPPAPVRSAPKPALFVAASLVVLMGGVSAVVFMRSPKDDTIAAPAVAPKPVVVTPVALASDPPARPADLPPPVRLALSAERDPQKIWAAIANAKWEGTCGERALHLAFTGSYARPRAIADGTPAAIELSRVGVVTLTRKETRGGTTTEEKMYLRLTSDLRGLAGNLETHYTSAGSTYEASADITLRRTP
ncbi:MAG: protein kinase [Deltaproteobacteria bacterium]|nr:protein kinase [Deltaproteobacteria bacterium]